LKTFKKETFQVSLASVPEVISSVKKYLILDIKKATKEYMYVYFSRFLNLLHTNLKNLKDKYK